MDIQVYQFENLTNEAIGLKLDAHDDFVIEGINRLNMSEAVKTVEKLIEDRGLRCRIYQKGRVAAAIGGTTVATGWIPVAGEAVILAAAAATAVGSAAHHLATFNPDYEVAKNLVTGTLTLTYQKKREVPEATGSDSSGATDPVSDNA